MNQYEDLTPLAAHYQPIQNKAMLQNLLIGLKPYYDIQQAEILDVAKGETTSIMMDISIFHKELLLTLIKDIHSRKEITFNVSTVSNTISILMTMKLKTLMLI